MKARALLDLIEKDLPKPVGEYEMSFDHGGKKAVALFDVMSIGSKSGSARPGPYSDDPYVHAGDAPVLKFKGASYFDGGVEIANLTEEEIENLETQASDSYADHSDNS